MNLKCYMVGLMAFLGIPACFAQTSIDLQTDKVVYTPGQSLPAGNNAFVFKNWVNETGNQNRVAVYDSNLLDYGLHFNNRSTNTIDGSVRLANNGQGVQFRASPVFGAFGNQTVVLLDSLYDGDAGETKPSVVLGDSGKFVLGPNAQVDLILDGSYFTRQLWVWGDGTGKFELHKDFVADLTNQADTAFGCGSLRFSNTHFISHASQSLPLGYRPNISTGIPDINAHLVFENEGGSVWEVATQDQEYKGGLWVRADMEIDCQHQLELSGVRTVTEASVGGTYTNYGGIHVAGVGRQITKTGPAALILSGEQAYDSLVALNVQKGLVHFLSDAYVPSINSPSGTGNPNGPHLGLGIQSQGAAKVSSDSLRIRKWENQGHLSILLTSLIQSDSAYFGGDLQVVLPQGMTLAAGDSFHILDFSWSNGQRFDQVFLNDLNGRIAWDTSALYSRGLLRVDSGSGTVTALQSVQVESGPRLYPNPLSTGQRLFIEWPARQDKALDIQVLNTQGQLLRRIRQHALGKPLRLEGLDTGVYFLLFGGSQGQCPKRTFIIKE